jgi:hypothetical protein
MFIKPKDCLQKCLLFGIGHQPVREIAAHGKPVRDARVEVDLVWDLDALQNDLGFVALLGRELPVGFWPPSASQRQPLAN